MNGYMRRVVVSFVTVLLGIAAFADAFPVHAETLGTAIPGWEKSACGREWTEWMVDEDVAELEILSVHSSNLMRNGPILEIVGTASGKQSFEDDVERCADGHVYYVEAFIESFNSFLVVASFYEEHFFVLVDRQTAHKTLLADEPHLDPTGRCFAAVSSGEAASMPPAIQVGCYDGTGVVYEAHWGGFGYQFVEWAGPDRINLSKLPGGNARTVAYLQRIEGRWHLIESVATPLGVE